MDASQGYFVIKLSPEFPKLIRTELTEEQVYEWVKLVGEIPGMLIIGNAIILNEHDSAEWKRTLRSTLFNEEE